MKKLKSFRHEKNFLEENEYLINPSDLNKVLAEADILWCDWEWED